MKKARQETLPVLNIIRKTKFIRNLNHQKAKTPAGSDLSPVRRLLFSDSFSFSGSFPLASGFSPYFSASANSFKTLLTIGIVNVSVRISAIDWVS